MLSFWQGSIEAPEASLGLIRDKDVLGRAAGLFGQLRSFWRKWDQTQFELNLIFQVKVCSLRARKDPSWESKQKTETFKEQFLSQTHKQGAWRKNLGGVSVVAACWQVGYHVEDFEHTPEGSNASGIKDIEREMNITETGANTQQSRHIRGEDSPYTQILWELAL